jgi:hypothetical protein
MTASALLITLALVVWLTQRRVLAINPSDGTQAALRCAPVMSKA